MGLKRYFWIFVLIALLVVPCCSWATVSSTTTRISYAGNDSQTVFPYTFYILEEEDLCVIVRSSSGVDTVQTLTTDYTVSGEGEASGGNVTMVTAPATGETLIIMRAVELTQDTNYVEGHPFSADTHEEALDRLTMITQQLEEELGRSIKWDRGSSLSDTYLPNPTASYLIGFNSGADGLAAYPSTTDAYTATTFDHIGNYSDSLSTAIATISTDEVTLIINKAITLTASDTVPNNIVLQFIDGGCVTLGAYNLTIPGENIAATPGQRIFNKNGAGNVVITGPTVVFPNWWVTNTTPGTTDMLNGLQYAINSTKGKGGKVGLLDQHYYCSAQVVVDDDFVTIKGACNPLTSASDKEGSVIEIGTTSGTALLIGSNPDGDTTAIKGLCLEDFRLHVGTNTDIAMRVWHPLHCTFRNLYIRGNSDNDASDNTGLKVEASQNCTFENILINGSDGAGGDTAKYLEYGLYNALGYGGQVSTTTEFKKIYVNYVRYGLYSTTFGVFRDCTFTHCYDRGLHLNTGKAEFFNCWLEGNEYDGYFATTTSAHFRDCYFGLYTGAQNFHFRQVGTSYVLLDTCYFGSDETTKSLFDNDNYTTGQTRIRFPRWSSSTYTIMANAGTTGGADQIKFDDMNVVAYEFYKAALPANFSDAAIDTTDTHDDQSYDMPMEGHVLGVFAQYEDSIGTGSYNLTVKINAGTAISLTTQTSSSLQIWQNYINDKVAAGDELKVHLATTADFATADGDMRVTVLVGFGDDGL